MICIRPWDSDFLKHFDMQYLTGFFNKLTCRDRKLRPRTGAGTSQGHTKRPAGSPLAPTLTPTLMHTSSSGNPMTLHPGRPGPGLRNPLGTGPVGAAGLSQPRPLRRPPLPHCPWKDTRGSRARCGSAPCRTPDTPLPAAAPPVPGCAPERG